MKLKRLMLSVAMAAMALTAGAAAEGNYLHVKTADGWKVLDLDKVDKLTFKGGNMTASDKDDNVVETVPMAALETMTFSEEPQVSGVNGVSDGKEGGEATFLYDSSARCVRMLADGAFELYSISGQLLVSIPEARAGETIDLTAVSADAVVMKSGSHSLKTILKR